MGVCLQKVFLIVDKGGHMIGTLFSNKKAEADEGEQVLLIDITDSEREMLPPGFEVVEVTQDGKIIAKDKDGHILIIK